MADALEIVARFTADTSDLDAGAEKASGSLGGIGTKSLLMGAAVVAGAGLAIAAIAEMTMAAAADAQEQAKLEQAIANAGAATDDSTAKVNAAIAASQARAFTDTATREALESLVTATGNVDEATALLATSQDIARAAGVDLATAADAVAKAQAGSDGALRKLLPGLAKGATATDTLAAAQKQAAGQADLFASSTEGSMLIAQDSFSELGETIGGAFLPILAEIVPKLVPIIAKFGELITAILPVLIPLISTVADVFMLVVDALMTAIDWIVKVITWLGPKLQPILKAVGTTLGVVTDAFNGVVTAIRSIIDWLANAIGAVGRFLDSINPLKDFKLPDIKLPFSVVPPEPVPAGATMRGGASSRAVGAVTVNVYGGDPRRVVRAVREGYRHWTGTNGRTAPDRDW